MQLEIHYFFQTVTSGFVLFPSQSTLLGWKIIGNVQFSENRLALLTKKLKSVIIVKYVVFRLFLYGTQVFIAEKPTSQREPVGISQLHV